MNNRNDVLYALALSLELDDDWNGYDCLKPTIEAIYHAKEFILQLPLNKCYPIQVSPDGEGGITLKWLLEPELNKKILLNFEEDIVNLVHEPINGENTYEDDLILEDHLSRILSYIPAIN